MALSDIDEILGLKDEATEEQEAKPDAESGDDASEGEAEGDGGGDPKGSEDGDGTGGEATAAADDAGDSGAKEGDEEAGEGEADAEGKPEADLAKQNAGLLKEIQRLRAERAAWVAKQSAQLPMAPTPLASTAPPTPGKPMVPVQVSPDGRSVYVDPDQLQEFIDARASEQVSRAMTPSPQQVLAARTNQMLSEFVAGDQARAQVVDRVNQADDFLTLQIQNLQAQGYRPQSVDEAVALLKQTGIDKAFAGYFPEIAPMLDEFVMAQASDQIAWKRSVLDRLAGTTKQARKPATTPTGAKRELGTQPRSMTRKGGSRKSQTSDEAEFKALEGEFRSDPAAMPEAKYKRYIALGKKIGVEGMD